jgi:pimeloyl-ACP methyl ester carboxylesterase
VDDVLVLPGRLFGSTSPLCLYASQVAERRGLTVHRHEWTGDIPDALGPEVEDYVVAQATPLVDGIGGRPLLIGKSLGSCAAKLAAERELPAVWLTPLLVAPWVADALRRATAPFLLVGGTNDRAWDSALARELTPHVLEVPDADHGMYVPGPLTDSIAVLTQMVVAVEDFLTKVDSLS